MSLNSSSRRRRTSRRRRCRSPRVTDPAALLGFSHPRHCRAAWNVRGVAMVSEGGCGHFEPAGCQNSLGCCGSDIPQDRRGHEAVDKMKWPKMPRDLAALEVGSPLDRVCP
jgi:hypothetical protein